MSGRGRAVLLVAAAVAVVAAVLAARGCEDEETVDRSGIATVASSAAAASGAAPSAPRERLPRARASTTTEASASASAEETVREPFLVDGWPAAQVIVRRPDGHVATGAWVYVHRAGADTPASLDEVVRCHVDGEGRVTLVAPEPGRYDIGAFEEGARLATLVTDVEFPARAPLEVALAETARLEIRHEGDLPPNGFVTIRRAAAERVTAFPGRHESKYVGLQTNDSLPSAIDVPRGVPLKIEGQYGVAVEPQTVTAPGTITVRADGAEPATFEFAFTGAAPPPDAALGYEMEVAAVGGGVRYATTFKSWNAGGAPVTAVRKELPCVRGPVEVQWKIVGVATGSTLEDTTNRSEGAVFRVEVPVADWGPYLQTVRVVISGSDGRYATVLGDESLFETVELGRESGPYARGIAYLAALGLLERPVLVADPVKAEDGRVASLRLMPAGTVRITVDWSRPLGEGWPITVERADGLPILMRNVPGRNGPFLAARARIDGLRLVIGPLAAGDVELVFRIAGREFGRKRVTVRADELVDLAGPPIVPPGPR